MNEIIIRNGKISDLIDCAKVFNLAFNKIDGESQLALVWEKAIQKELFNLVVVEIEKEIVAFGGFTIYKNTIG